MTPETKQILIGILYRLYHLQNSDNILDPINYPEKQARNPERPNWEKREAVFRALQWAMNNPNTDFKKLQKVRYTHEEVYYFLKQEYLAYKKLMDERQ